MSVILQVSDAHFGTERAEVVEALAELARRSSPDLLILSGDVTQRARAAQFAAAAAFVQRLGPPHLVAIPGNHDIPLFDVATRLLDPYANFRRAFGDELEPRFIAPDCVVVSVKTTRRYRHVDGEISEAQRERVADELRAADNAQLRIVVTHQPVAVPRDSEQHNVAHGSELAVRSWAAAGADVLLAGHIHLPFVLPLHEVMRPLPKSLWAVNAGTAVSSRVRYDAGNSVNVLRTSPGEPRSFLLERWDFNRQKSAFIESAQLRLQC
jgi:3',5'-cyclic AMP phosphodiesterase CpdA